MLRKIIKALTLKKRMRIEVTKKPFWKREKYWKEKFEGYVLNLIVNPIEKMIAEMEESHDGE